MFFDLNDDDEKRLLELLKFKRRAIFNDDELCFGIESKPLQTEKGENINKSVQVNLLNETVEQASQTRSKKHKETQTEISEVNDNQSVTVGNDLILDLLNRNLSTIEEALIENCRTKAFKNYDVNWFEGGNRITNPFVLINRQLVKNEDLEVTAISWTCKGGTICVAYGRYDHESVCTHKGSLCTWNIDLIKIKFDKPDISVETPFCISSIATHPEHPGVVAVGLFNGDIIVYDVRQDDPLVAAILDKKDTHSDEVTVLKWIKDSKSTRKKYYLLSASRDGKILIWNALPTKNQLKLSDGFIMLLDYLPTQGFKSLGIEMSVSALCVNSEDKDTFIVGCDSGGLFKCSFSSVVQANAGWLDQLSIKLKSPIKLAFDVENCPIYSLNSSPFHRNLFLTCGTHGEVRVYSLLQTTPLLHLCSNIGYLYSVDWSPSRPCVFASSSHSGDVLIYDMLQTTSNSVQKIKVSNKPVYTLEFNKARPGYLATGDSEGFVKIWYLSNDLIHTDMDELSFLNEISEKPFEK